MQGDSQRELGASRRMLHVTERELQRILLDIHDGPVQYMYAALSQLDLLRGALEGRAPALEAEVHERTERIRLLLEGGLNEIRSFIGAFRPPEFEGRDLRTLLEGLILQHEAMTDTEVALDVAEPLHDVDLPVKITLFRILQEGLSNAYRHGGARRVIVRLAVLGEGEGEGLRMEIEDDGAGFDTSVAVGGEHFGLAGMRARSEMIGGSLRLRSAPGKGTTVSVVVPA